MHLTFLNVCHIWGGVEVATGRTPGQLRLVGQKQLTANSAARMLHSFHSFYHPILYALYGHSRYYG